MKGPDHLQSAAAPVSDDQTAGLLMFKMTLEGRTYWGMKEAWRDTSLKRLKGFREEAIKDTGCLSRQAIAE